MRHFVECVRDGATPRETYEDGYVVNCVLDAGYRSMRSGRWVRVRA
jgi:predicted dehydrogenase